MSDSTVIELRQDGEEALAELQERVKEATVAMLELLRENDARTWTIRELQDAAADGRSPTATSLAFLGLIKARVIDVDDDLRVHVVDR